MGKNIIISILIALLIFIFVYDKFFREKEKVEYKPITNDSLYQKINILNSKIEDFKTREYYYQEAVKNLKLKNYELNKKIDNFNKHDIIQWLDSFCSTKGYNLQRD